MHEEIFRQEETNQQEESLKYEEDLFGEDILEDPAETVYEVEDKVAEDVSGPKDQRQEEGLYGEPPAEETTTSTEEVPLTFENKKVPYHERFYLKYREGKRSTPLDLDGTKAFLRQLGFDGGELRQAREGKNQAENFRNADSNKNNQTYCSYCGAEIAGVEFYRMPDGRMRCTNCSSTLVKTKAEVEELYQRVITNMENFFCAVIDVPISIEVMDERKLKKKIGASLGTKDDQSLLILGVSINKKKEYGIILENGAPRISLIATFAHELTHIWQYMNWDNKKNFKKCPKNKRLLIYEGMAKWVEIQYLYLIGETNVAKREEYVTRNRQDEYGIGFCLYEDRYPLSREAMTCEDTPFTPDKYPFD